MLRLAIVATVYRYLSHAQHMGDRFLVGYPRVSRTGATVAYLRFRNRNVHARREETP